MAKKSRRARTTPRLSAAQLVGTGDVRAAAEDTPVAPRRATAASPVRGTLVREDYSYVVSDLKRIGVLAGALLAIIAILAVVLPQVMP